MTTGCGHWRVVNARQRHAMVKSGSLDVRGHVSYWSEDDIRAPSGDFRFYFDISHRLARSASVTGAAVEIIAC
jgi:hypothetical protein